MRFFSATDNRWLRACPPLRPSAPAIREMFMAGILLGAKHLGNAASRDASPVECSWTFTTGC